MKPIILEVCANSPASCVEAERGGASRVELCAGMPEGGTTPSYGDIKIARSLISIELNVIIRPRGGDFLYSELEVQSMVEDIRIAKALGANGVVFGALTASGDVDKVVCKRLMDECEGLSTTFHRAIDVARNPLEALEDIIELGFDRILTSGAKPTALQGKAMLKALGDKAQGRIIIMAGSGVNPSNIKELYDYTALKEFHSSARHSVPSQMQHRSTEVSFGGEVVIPDYSTYITSSEIVADLINKCK